MVVEALTLPRNEHSDALLEELSSAKQTPKNLAVIQNAAMYYQALVTKRQAGTMSTADRDLHARTNYKNFTVPSFLAWYKLVCGITPPPWLTAALMGKSTGTDKGEQCTTMHHHARSLLWLSTVCRVHVLSRRLLGNLCLVVVSGESSPLPYSNLRPVLKSTHRLYPAVPCPTRVFAAVTFTNSRQVLHGKRQDMGQVRGGWP